MVDAPAGSAMMIIVHQGEVKRVGSSPAGPEWKANNNHHHNHHHHRHHDHQASANDDRFLREWVQLDQRSINGSTNEMMDEHREQPEHFHSLYTAT